MLMVLWYYVFYGSMALYFLLFMILCLDAYTLFMVLGFHGCMFYVSWLRALILMVSGFWFYGFMVSFLPTSNFVLSRIYCFS